MPDSFLRLLQLLEQPERNKSMQPLTLATALTEMSGWVNDGRGYEHHNHASAWDGCFAALQSAYSNSGQRLATCCSQAYQAMHKSFPPDEASRSDLRKRTAFASALKTLRELLQTGDARAAAFQDLAAAANRASSARAMFHTRDTFLDLLDLAHWSRRETAARLAGILGDHSWHVNLALELSQREPLRTVDEPGSRTAGLTPPESLQLVADFLRSEQPTGINLVWLAYDHAVVRGGWAPIPEVQLFPADWLVPNLDTAAVHHAAVPAEMRLSDSRSFLSEELPTGQGVIYVRLDLGRGPAATAVQRAEQAMDGIIGLARPEGFFGWRQLKGYLHFFDGHLVSRGEFLQAIDVAEISWRHEENGDAIIDQIAQHGGSILRKGLPPGGLDAVQWLRACHDVQGTPSLLMAGRVVEFVASRASMTWDKHLVAHFADRWILEQVVLTTFGWVRQALSDLGHLGETDPGRAAFLRLDNRRPGTALHELNLAASIMSTGRGSVLAFLLGEWIRQLASAAAFTASVKNLRNDYTAHVNVFIRYRNAIAHGGPLPDLHTLHLRRFCLSMAERSYREFLQAHESDQDLTARLRTRADRAATILAAVCSAAAPLEELTRLLLCDGRWES
ncbi:hypothetical protein [Catellatospora vulcania]|uniref:hypothetical protein n=1 Tax=Catellatospora vulcania TaxID=1460450 RepID=UPI0012D49E53|nr:hypothetical protein [Catellatospora vulcania]